MEILILILFLLFGGQVQSNNHDSITNADVFNEEVAKALIELKLDSESLRTSAVSTIGKDEDGSYIVRQSSKATTVVMEWYHVDLRNLKVTCELQKDYCLRPISTDKDQKPRELTQKQLDAIEIAKKYANEHYAGLGYLDDITYVAYVQEESDGRVTIRVFNPGTGGMTETIDWLTVDVEKNQVESSRKY